LNSRREKVPEEGAVTDVKLKEFSEERIRLFKERDGTKLKTKWVGRKTAG